MNFRRRKHTTAEVHAGALSDILFFLMLFFLIISTLASPSAVRLMLPRANNTVATEPNKKPVKISITNDLRYYIDDNEVPFASLENSLGLSIRNNPKPVVVLRMDRTISVDEMMKVLDIVNKMKLPIVLAVDKKTD